jgi:hypothetical protein
MTNVVDLLSHRASRAPDTAAEAMDFAGDQARELQDQLERLTCSSLPKTSSSRLRNSRLSITECRHVCETTPNDEAR